jgi:DNA-binding GntR family transcriptional regulator
MTIGQSHQSLREVVVDELRRLILSGEFAAGERLKEEVAAERLGVSRLPVREAFRRLEAEGLLRSQPRRGVVVTPPGEDELAIVQSVRLQLELIAVEAAARRQEPEAMERLKAFLAAGQAAAEANDKEAVAEMNAAFHETLTAGCGSAYLGGLLRSVRNQAQHLIGGWHTVPDASWRAHEPIMTAVLDADVEQAVALMQHHLVYGHERPAPTV